MAADRPKISVTAWGGGSTAGESPPPPPAEARLASTLAAELTRLGLAPPASAAAAAAAASARLQVPTAGRPQPLAAASLWCDESELIHSCGLLSHMLGMPKSFSTGDIAQLLDGGTPRRSVSLTTLQERPELAQPALEPTSRSCSTWVAVGDLGTSSQLPSPQGRQTGGQTPFSAADLVRAVNKKVRQNYIRRRLQVTFKALQRLSQSELSLEQLLSGELPASCRAPAATPARTQGTSAAVTTAAAATPADTTAAAAAAAAAAPAAAASSASAATRAVSVRQVDRERGQPLTRFQRNMMVFNWLQTLEDDCNELKVA